MQCRRCGTIHAMPRTTSRSSRSARLAPACRSSAKSSSARLGARVDAHIPNPRTSAEHWARPSARSTRSRVDPDVRRARLHSVRRRRTRAAHRVRERRQSLSGPRHRTTARDRGASCRSARAGGASCGSSSSRASCSPCSAARRPRSSPGSVRACSPRVSRRAEPRQRRRCWTARRPARSTAPLAFTAAVAVLTGVVFGLVPALQSTKPSLTSALKDDVGSWGVRLRGVTSRNVLTVVEFTFAVVLLAGSGLMIRSLRQLTSVRPGLRACTSADAAGESSAELGARFHRSLLRSRADRLATFPACDRSR